MLSEKCSVCHKEIEYPDVSKRQIFTSHQKACSYMKEKYGHIDVKELEELYYNQGYSVNDLSNHFNVGKGIRNYMDRLGIQLRSISEQRKTDRSKSKYEKNHNFLKSHPSRIEWESRLLETEGIFNVFQRESVKSKIKETLFSRYGVDHPMRDKEIAKKCIDVRLKNGTFTKFIRFSGIHKKICSLLDDMHTTYSIEYYLNFENKRYFYDIKVNDTLIEVNGDYYHANPKFYKKDDLFSFKGKLVCAQEIWEGDNKKKEAALAKGFNYLCIWESDIHNNIDSVKQQLKHIASNELKCD